MDNFLLYANHYYNFGINVSNITPIRKSFHLDDTVLKAPSHSWKQYSTQRQKLSVLQSYDWKNACGVGLILGFGNLRAFDVDVCKDFSIINDFLRLLKLPPNYEWVVQSGSQVGFHIIFTAEEHNYPTPQGKVKAFKPNLKNEKAFKHLELRWIGHLVLPPSIHVSYNRYKFTNDKFPSEKPLVVQISDVEACVNFFCSKRNNSIEEDSLDTIREVYLDTEDENETDDSATQKSKVYLDTNDTEEKQEATDDKSKVYLDTEEDDEQE